MIKPLDNLKDGEIPKELRTLEDLSRNCGNVDKQEIKYCRLLSRQCVWQGLWMIPYARRFAREATGRMYECKYKGRNGI